MRKRIDIFFCVGFVILLLIPLLFTDLRKEQKSEIDNKFLPEIDWNESLPIQERVKEIENWLNMRIGLRKESLNLYQRLNDKLFHMLEHPTYMYGKKNWVFFRDDSDNYQHLNLDLEWAKQFAEWMKRFETISESYGVAFYYMLIPDKETVYPEFYPDGYNIRGNISRTDQVLEMMENIDVDCFYAYDVLVKTKKDMLVANEKYDAGHWNENGAFVSLQAMINHLRIRHPSIPVLDAEEFVIGTIHKDSLPVSIFYIDEDVPDYKLKRDLTIVDSGFFIDFPPFDKNSNYHTHTLNPTNKDLPKLLVFMDSYMMGKEKFLVSHFSEVTFIHRKNITGPRKFSEYIELVQPDIVIYENPERVFPITFNKKK